MKQASLMLGELRTVALSPQKYYELYMQVWSELHHLESFFGDPSRHGRTNLELYELVQHAGNILPRLYLLITVGSVYIKSKEGAAKDVLRDLVEMAKGVQQPVHGLFLRAYLSQASKALLPDVGSEYADPSGAGGDVRDAVDFVLQNFTEMNKLWVRMQHAGGSASFGVGEKDGREKERRELRDLVGKNVHVLSSLEGLDLELYAKTVLPRILEQIVRCKDDIAQPYLMDAVVQVFPDDFHVETLDVFLRAVPLLKPSSRGGETLASLMDRLARAAGEHPELIAKFAETDALGEFRKCVAALVRDQPELEARERVSMHAAMMSFAVAAREERLEVIDGIFASCASALGAAPTEGDGIATNADSNSKPPAMIVADPRAAKQLAAFLTVPLETFDIVEVLRRENYRRATALLHPVHARSVAVTVLERVSRDSSALRDPKHVETLFEFCAVLFGAGDGARDAATGAEETTSELLDAEDFEEAGNLMARLVRKLRNDHLPTQLELLRVAKTQFSRGGAVQARRAAPALAFAALELGRDVSGMKDVSPDQNSTDLMHSVLQFLHEIILSLERAAAHDLALRLCLESAWLADASGSEHVACDFFERAMTSYEEEIVDSKKQKTALWLVAGTLRRCANFSDETWNGLVDKTVGYATRLLRKPDRVSALCACARLRWGGSEVGRGETKVKENAAEESPEPAESSSGSGDAAGAVSCLQKASKIANAALEASATTGSGAAEAVLLLLSVLNSYLWFFERGCDGVTAGVVAELVERINAELNSFQGACPLDLRAYHAATMRHVEHQKAKGGAIGARYEELKI